jgi:hypothetical protein
MVEGGNQALINYVQLQEKKQRRSSEIKPTKRRESLLQSVDPSIGKKRNSSDSKNLTHIDLDFDKVYSGKSVAAYCKLLSDRIRWMVLKSPHAMIAK